MIDLDTLDLSTLRATLTTTKGDLVVRFFADVAPNHVRNFAALAQDGFYNGIAFHRIMRQFMIQGGCPNTRAGATGTPGTGGPGHRIVAEFNDRPHSRGALSMARSTDPNSAGSQFFIVHGEHVEQLDGSYTVFGEVYEGLDVLDEIANVEVGFGPNGERSKPAERIEIESVQLEVAPADAAEPATEPVADSPAARESDSGASAAAEMPAEGES